MKQLIIFLLNSVFTNELGISFLTILFTLELGGTIRSHDNLSNNKVL